MTISPLKGKKILLGITGSIAAYKSAILLRRLKELGAEVKVVMTPTATKFISGLSISTLAGNEVYHDLIDNDQWNSHVELGLWADLMLIAPLTANTLGKMYAGICDNMVLACWLSAKCPIAIAPAMDRDMYLHPSTERNLSVLEKWKHFLIPSEYGELASGLVGYGRMAEPESIVAYLNEKIFAQSKKELSGKKILITAGPTYEDIDPVRFIGNGSTGKMGCAIADVCASQGAEVNLILGPTHIRPEHSEIKIYPVRSAQQMYNRAVELFPAMDAAFMSAAVADYRVAEPKTQKIKKDRNDGGLQLELIPNPDIALELGKMKKAGQFIGGFALETEDGIQNARAKLVKKNFDIIIMNNLNDEGAGFAHNTNKVTIVTADEKPLELPLMSKLKVAENILNYYLKIQKS